MPTQQDDVDTVSTYAVANKRNSEHKMSQQSAKMTLNVRDARR